MWQGLDVTDTGYAVSNMELFFRDYPANINDPGVGSCWLTYFIGGVWCQLMGGCGLIGFRVLYVLIQFSTVGFVWLALRNKGSRLALWAVAGGVLMVLAKSPFFPSYNELTVLFFVAAMVALYYGLVDHRMWLVFLAGTVGGASVFVRLPNLAIASLGSGILFVRLGDAWDGTSSVAEARRLALKECLLFACGYLSGIAAVLALMAAMGQIADYVRMLGQMSAMFGDAKQHHGGGSLLRGLFHDYFYVVISGAVALAVGTGAAWLVAATQNKPLKWGFLGACAVILALLCLRFSNFALYFWPGAIYAILLAGAFGFLGLDRENRLLCALTGMVLFVAPLGSNNGIHNAVYAMPLAVPVAMLALGGRKTPTSNVGDVKVGIPAGGSQGDDSTLVSETARKERSVQRWAWASYFTTLQGLPAMGIGCAFLGAMIIFSVVGRWNFTYRDSPERATLRVSIDHPKLRGIYTTPARARSLQQLLDALRPLLRKGDYLLDQMQIPMLYYLTEARPYLYSTWANLYEPGVFARKLREAESTRRGLPVFVETEIDTCHPLWPAQTYAPLQSYRFVENRRLMTKFLQDHNYKMTWQNDAFAIWLPPAFDKRG